ncbi:hypothetical protein MWN33_18785 [Starkeya koreensis]|uniref:Uncharacterized protein n=1 Tax=Ancylobacter koreensis TaxID=266121 RepID=A0ABT0DS27_9HYPH|nr:hypothetical protein [Ancylobacter koreensis]MCK0210082.1 hypothetical protein [Ancylobacter koreensis]
MAPGLLATPQTDGSPDDPLRIVGEAVGLPVSPSPAAKAEAAGEPAASNDQMIT